MIYQLYDYGRALLAPAGSMAELGARLFSEPESWMAHLPGAPRVAAGYEVLHRISKTYEKPEFGITAVEAHGERVAVLEETVVVEPFCHLKRFRRLSDDDAVNAAMKADPVVLVVAPLSGHYATLLRDTVRTLLAGADVYVTDWMDARMVPLDRGAFTLDDYVVYVRRFVRELGAERLHVMAVCQPAVPVLSAAALMASAGEAEPRSLILMGGPIDTRHSKTQVNEFATGHSLDWFKTYLTDDVPARYPGHGRRVYPGFLLHAGFMALNPIRHLGSHWDFYRHLVEGDLGTAEEHRRFYDEFNAVMDLPAEYYLDCIRIVFQEQQLPRGVRYVGGERVAPEAITRSSLLTIEGELDNISGPGETRAALDLCSGIPADRKRHVTVEGAGHYGIFSGRRWRTVVYPQVRDFIAAAEARAGGPTARA
ncbi:MAG TPA: polyhydroxyalkanoate depolymerase [Polyangia bacterium]|nr:polyhydroxyalkanoate depolymerase [Polyangia bacterium]